MHGLGTEPVRADARDLAVGFLEAEDHLEGLLSPASGQHEDDGLPLDVRPLDPHRLRPRLRRPLVVPVHDLVQEVRRAAGGVATTDMERVADVLGRAVLEHERHQACDVPRVVALDEAIDQLG